MARIGPPRPLSLLALEHHDRASLTIRGLVGLEKAEAGLGTGELLELVSDGLVVLTIGFETGAKHSEDPLGGSGFILARVQSVCIGKGVVIWIVAPLVFDGARDLSGLGLTEVLSHQGERHVHASGHP